ncbi:hypothetical protein F5B19DRAFT_82927 [Rostrohypoxylon terebratum]|nr:hypothetical protein F5B19DRAFT_82927 [Rostrohypoxylon terebratum]
MRAAPPILGLFIFFNGFGLARVGRYRYTTACRVKQGYLGGSEGGSTGFWDLGVNGNGVFWLVGSSFLHNPLYPRHGIHGSYTRYTKQQLSSRRRRKYLRGPERSQRTEGSFYYNPIERHHVSLTTTYLTKSRHMINVT